MSFKSDQLKPFGTRESREVGEREMIQNSLIASRAKALVVEV